MLMLNEYLETLIKRWLENGPFDHGVVKHLKYHLENGFETANMLCFRTVKGCVYAISPGLSPELKVLGQPFLTSLERRVAIHKWGYDNGLIYLGEYSLKSNKEGGCSVQHKVYKEMPGTAPWLPDGFPKVTYFGYKVHSFGEVMIPVTNLMNV